MRRRGPMRRRRGGRQQRYHGMKFMKETILKEQVTIGTGAFPVYVKKFACNFMNISQNASYIGVSANTAIPALFGRYCITGCKWTFIPYNTQATTGGIGADRVCYAINRDPQDVLTGETDIIRQDDCKFTNSTRKFSVYVKHPKPILAATANQLANNRGLDNTQYADPQVGPPDQNQVAFTTGDNKWVWLPTRVARNSNVDPPTQYPDHVGLDVVITSSRPVVDTSYNLYNVYQTLYLALKEQD